MEQVVLANQIDQRSTTGQAGPVAEATLHLHRAADSIPDVNVSVAYAKAPGCVMLCTVLYCTVVLLCGVCVGVVVHILPFDTFLLVLDLQVVEGLSAYIVGPGSPARSPAVAPSTPYSPAGLRSRLRSSQMVGLVVNAIPVIL